MSNNYQPTKEEVIQLAVLEAIEGGDIREVLEAEKIGWPLWKQLEEVQRSPLAVEEMVWGYCEYVGKPELVCLDEGSAVSEEGEEFFLDEIFVIED